MNKLLFSTLALLVFCQCTTPQKKEVVKNSSATTTARTKVFADKIDLSDLNGEAISLSAYKGKTVILNVWATWCKPCIAEMPSLIEMQKQLPNDSYALILASSESLEKINKFKNRNDYEFNYVQLSTSAESLGVYALPTTFIINNKGELVITENGSKDWSSPESIEEITHLPNL